MNWLRNPTSYKFTNFNVRVTYVLWNIDYYYHSISRLGQYIMNHSIVIQSESGLGHYSIKFQ